MFTNIGLVAHAKKALAENWKYVYGTIGQVLTASSVKATTNLIEINKHPSLSGHLSANNAVDCVNLILILLVVG